MRTSKSYQIETISDKILFNDLTLYISRENNKKLFFNIKKQPYYTETYNTAEAVSILMRNKTWCDITSIWNIELSTTDKNVYSTAGVLLWASGGHETWNKMNLDWLDYYNQLDIEYNKSITKIMRKSNTLGDIRNGFIKYLNLDKLYNSILRLSTI